MNNPENESPAGERKILYIKTLSNVIYEISFDPDDTIFMIKTKIHATHGIHRDTIRLIFKGKRLEDSRSNNDYGITFGSTLNMVLRLLAGAQITDKNDNENENETDPNIFNYQFNSNLSNLILSISSLDFELDSSNSTFNLCVLKWNSKVKQVFEEIIKETLKCASIKKFTLGEVSLENLNIGNLISHIVNKCILPLLKIQFDKLIKNNYSIEGTIFCEGNKNLSEISDKFLADCNKGFPLHVDDSELTINLCLGGEFSGSKLEFKTGEVHEYSVSKGVVHSGNLEHWSTPCEGSRYNMLLFLK